MKRNLLRSTKTYHVYFIVIVIILLFNLLCPSSSPCDTQEKNSFDGEIVFDRASNGFHIFKINGLFPADEIQLTKKDSLSVGNDFAPKWSPDGAHIAYINRDAKNRDNIVLTDSIGTSKRRITNFDEGIIIDIVWDKRGKEIIFSYNPNKPGMPILKRIVNVKTGEIKNAPNDSEKIIGCDSTVLSFNESLLICSKALISNKQKITTYNSENDKEIGIKKIFSPLRNLFKKDHEDIIYKNRAYKKISEITLDNASDPLPSKNGFQFAVTSGNQLIVIDKDGNKIIQSENLCKSEGAACLRSWSNDSNKLLYSCYCGAEGIQEKIYLININTKKSFYLTEGQNPDWYFK